MKNIKISISVFIILLLFAIFQADRLLDLRKYNEFKFSDNTHKKTWDLNKILVILEDEEADILELKHNDEYWQGEVTFKGELEDFVIYINRLKENNIYIKNYRFEKVEGLKCFLQLKAF